MSRFWGMMSLLAILGTARADEPKPTPTPDPALATQLAAIRAEYDAQLQVYRTAVDQAPTPQAASGLYAKLGPDDVTFARRLIDLALTKPTDPAARDACLWVVDKPGRGGFGLYGDEFARAVAILVRHHGDDPIAVSVGLVLNNAVAPERDKLLFGFMAAAKQRETQGIARLALAIYLESKVAVTLNAHKFPARLTRTYRNILGADGIRQDKQVAEPVDEFAYRMSLRFADPDAIRAESERLYQEVISDYGDVPSITPRLRELIALSREPNPTWNGKPLTADERHELAATVARQQTLGEVATGHLDELHNIAVGKPAPAIDGLTLDGKPLKLSDYRGKVVALVFWGSWCGPCLAEIPHERDLAARFRDRPFALLGVDCNDKQDAAQKVVADEKITWPNWYDGHDGDGPIVQRYHIRGYPSSFIIDAQGIIRHKGLRGDSMADAVGKLLDEIKPTNAAPAAGG